jgi:SOS-response transcriptional repressor LexA
MSIENSTSTSDGASRPSPARVCPTSGEKVPLRLQNDSMSDPGADLDFPIGCLIVVDATVTPMHGDIVVVRPDGVGDAMVRQLDSDGARDVLKPFNPRPWLWQPTQRSMASSFRKRSGVARADYRDRLSSRGRLRAAFFIVKA